MAKLADARGLGPRSARSEGSSPSARTPEVRHDEAMGDARLRTPVSLAELMAALSLAVDLGFDQPMEHLLRQYKLPTDLRGDGIYAVGRKQGPVRERYPSWLYS